MKYSIYKPTEVCVKCCYPTAQMPRQFFEGSHDILVDKEVKQCTIQGEHIHYECPCGHELTYRPVDWETKKAKALVSRKKISTKKSTKKVIRGKK